MNTTSAKIVFFFLTFLGSVFAQPLSPVLPKWDAYTSNQTPELSWNLLENVSFYTVELSPVADFSAGVISSPSLFTNAWIPSVLSYGKWYWRVSCDVGGNVQQSSVYQFNIYSPDSNPNLEFWVHAGAGVTTDGGGFVQEWIDQSSNGYSMTQINAVERPAINTSAINGLPALSFSGAHFLEGGDILDIGTNSRGMILVAKTGGGNEAIIAKSIAAGANSRYALFQNGGQTTFLYEDVTGHDLNSSYVPSSYSLYRVVNDRYLGENSLVVNNNYLGSTSIFSPHNMNSSFRFLIGAYSNASDDGEIIPLNGEIAEIVFLDFVDTNENLAVENYLRDKYNPPLDLGPDMAVTDFCDTTLVATAGYTNLLWSTGETTPTIDVNEGAYWVEGTDIFGFVHRDTIVVNYLDIPSPPTTGVCAGSNVVWNADVGPGFTYLWSTTETTPSISITAAGNYSVQVFDGFGCSKNSPVETFYIDNYETTAWLGNDTTLCIGNDLYLQVGAAETVSYLWPDASTTPLYGGDTTGMYWVTATNVNGCVAQDTINITILGTAPDAYFNTPDDCLGQTTLFTDASIPQGGDPLVSWDWNFGDTNTDNIQNTSNTYATDGMYVVTLDILAQSGCGDRFIDTVFVFIPPTANYSFIGHCSLDSVMFNDLSVIGDTALALWSWDFGQPSSGQNLSSLQDPNHLYDEVNVFNVQLIVTDENGCQDTIAQFVNIDPSPESLFTLNDGCLDAPLDLTNNATISAPGFITSYSWDFGDGTGSASSNPSKSYVTHGLYDVQLITTSDLACTDTVVQQVTIHAMPVPNFSFSNECVGLPTLFTDVSTVADGIIDSTRWIYDVFDTLYGNPSYFVFDTEGDHFVKLTTISEWGCQRDTIKVVPVGPELSASFTTMNAGSIVVGAPVQFDNNSIGGDNYNWDLGDATFSVEISPTHSYDEQLLDSMITVELIASNSFGCSDTMSQSYTISRAMLDLEVQKLFLLENNGYFDVAVQLHNKGTARIEGADLELTLQNGTSVLEVYPDTLYAGQTQIYVLNAHPSAVFSEQDGQDGFACLKASPYSNPVLPEEDWTNNERCQNVEGTDPILIGPHPNPSDGIVELGVLLTQESAVELALFDERGRIVMRIYDQSVLEEGYHSSVVDLSAYGNGVYTLRLIVEDFVSVKKLVKK